MLSDAELRKRYDEFGSEGVQVGPAGGFMDPKEFFRKIFGGDAFVDIIGDISFAQLFAQVQEDQEAEAGSDGKLQDASMDGMTARQKQEVERERRRKKMEEEMKRARDGRVKMLSEKLLQKLTMFTDGLYSKPEFEEYIKKESMILKKESMGVELLQAIGYTYGIKARQCLGREEFLGLPGIWHSMREKGHMVSQLFSTVKAASKAYKSAQKIEESSAAKRASTNTSNPMDEELDYDQIQPPPELLKDAETNIRNLMVKGAQMEIQSVLGDVCDRVLNLHYPAPGVAKQVVKKRAQGLKIIGDIYRKVERDGTEDPSFF